MAWASMALRLCWRSAKGCLELDERTEIGKMNGKPNGVCKPFDTPAQPAAKVSPGKPLQPPVPYAGTAAILKTITTQFRQVMDEIRELVQALRESQEKSGSGRPAKSASRPARPRADNGSKPRTGPKGS